MNGPTFQMECPSCKQQLKIGMPIPSVRSLIQPIDNITVYRITSEEIKAFLIQKAKFFKPEAKIELAVKYIEKRKKNKNDPHVSYGALTIAFSDDVLDQKNKEDWYNRIGNNDMMRPDFIEDIFVGMIQKYQYNRKEIDEILDNYKLLEELEEKTGINEASLEDIKLYTTPRRVPTTTKESWIFFSIRPEKVIEDMLENPDDDQVHGSIGKIEAHQINKDVVEFIIYVHQNNVKASENPLVRQLLQGKGANKK